MNREFWQSLLDWLRGVVWGNNRAISEEDMDLYRLVDTAEEAYALIDASHITTALDDQD